MAHRPHWQDAPREAVRAKVSEFLGANSEGWIIDGNYQNMVADITWNSATDIIWLDYPIFVVLWRLLFRTIRRIRSGEKLWGMEGCIETWRSQFFSSDSLLFIPYFNKTNGSLWVFWFYRYRRPMFYRDLAGKEKGKLEGANVIWFQWPGKTQAWLEALKADSDKSHLNGPNPRLIFEI